MDELFLCINYKVKAVGANFSRELVFSEAQKPVARELWESLGNIDSDISQV